MRGGRILFAILLLTAALPAGLLQAQQPNDPGHRGTPGNGQPTTMPPQMLDRPPSQAMPVVPDTVEIVVSVPDSLPQPEAVWVVQDTLAFGGLLNLVLDYAPDQIDGPDLKPVTPGEWLVAHEEPEPGLLAKLFSRETGPVVDMSGLPDATGLRVVRSFRVYRHDPLQIRWEQYLSPVLVVSGQTAGTDEIASIRQPRSLVWTPWRLILLGLLLTALGILFYWLWRRRLQPEPMTHWTIPAPAWLATTVGLHGLMNENFVARGDTAQFLDRLAFLARDFVANRYRIAAREMTGQEIIRACSDLGHDPSHPAGFARLIDLADRERYNPSAPDAAFCREQAVQLFGRVGRVRLERYYVAVAPDRQLAAEKAWATLVADLGTGAGRAVKPITSGEVQ